MKTLKELMNLQGRVALITGGTGHIGGAIAEAYAELGARLAIVGRDEKKGDALAKKLKDDYGADTLVLTADFEKEEEVRVLPGQVLERFGRLDILVNNAAFVGTSSLQGWGVPFKEQSAATWRRALEVNLTAVFVLVQACAEALEQSGHGSVINIGSIYGIVGPQLALYEGTTIGNPGAYAASKGGLLQLTRWLASVMAPKVRVNMITFGGVFREHKEPFLSRYVSRTPLGRMATEEDAKGAAVYLASDASAYVTGHNLVVDGGWTVW